jgi:hypothetical protein
MVAQAVATAATSSAAGGSASYEGVIRVRMRGSFVCVCGDVAAHAVATAATSSPAAGGSASHSHFAVAAVAQLSVLAGGLV